MTTTLTSRPAPEWLRDLAEARARYEELLGWPVSIQVGSRDLALVIGARIGAVSMPARLGARVRQELGFALLSGPILADPSASWWTFLTKPTGALRPDVAHDLAAVRARIAPRGATTQIPLPPTDRRWVERPTRPLPPASAVIAIVRRLTYDDGHLAA
jgi:hypothetical protein